MAEKFVIKDKRVWRMRSWMSTPWLMHSFMVVIIDGTMDNGTACSAMRRCSDPSEIDVILAFFVAHPMNTGRRSS